MNLLELVYQRCKARREANALLDRAVSESRNLTVAESVQCDALMARIHEIDAALEARAALRTA